MVAGMAMVMAEEPLAEFEVLKTKWGPDLKGVKVLVVEPDGLRVLHDAGAGKVAFESLPETLQQRFGFDRRNAEEYRQQEEKKQQEVRRRVAEALRQEQERRREEAVMQGLEWRYMTVIVSRVMDEGLLCYRYQPGGMVGETGRVLHWLTGTGRMCVPEKIEYNKPMFVQGISKDKGVAEGDILRGYAGRRGAKEIEGRILPWWISKPD